jgi:Lipid-binding putative hydrolase
MKKIKSNIKYIALVLLAGIVTVACNDDGYDDYSAGGTPTEAMNGEWWIDISDATTGDVYAQHTLHRTYDDNNGGMWISDRDGTGFTGWWLESVVNVDTKNLTFSATDAFNNADESEVTITEGKIIKNGGHSATGVVVDSIYFKGVFNYDPETVLIFAGTKRTGFEEEE